MYITRMLYTPLQTGVILTINKLTYEQILRSTNRFFA